jgi:tight adherence protein C
MLDWMGAPVVLVFLGTSALIFLLFLFLEGGQSVSVGPGLLAPRRHNRGRLGELALAALPRLGTPLMPETEQEQTRLQQRLIHAGLYSQTALARFLGLRVVLLIGGLLAAVAIGLSGLFSLVPGLLLGCTLVALALVGPGLWLDWKIRDRQRSFRRALPDVIDVITICLEGGLSLPEAIRRVSEELETAHPALGEEMIIVQREMLLGLSAGEALRKFASRSGLPEVRHLASVILHAERYGVSTVAAMRVEADGMRQARQQRAEEMAQRAAVKILFPTLLLIFPAIFIVVLGPAVYGIMEAFSKTR